MKNYWSISLLTVFSKILKKARHCRLSQHLHTNNIMFTEQFGFRKEKSSEDAAFRLADSVFESINQKMHVGGIFCEFVKGCDL